MKNEREVTREHRPHERADLWRNLFAVIGRFGTDGPSENVGREHDQYLDEAYGDWRDR